MKIFLRTAVILTAAFFLISCGTYTDPEPATKVKLSYWHYDAPTGGDQINSLITFFNESQDQIEIVSRYIPNVDYKKSLLLAIAEGNPPDLALMEMQTIPHYSELGALASVEPYIDVNDYLDLVLNECMNAEGEIVALPLGFTTDNLFYNTDFFDEAGLTVPKTQEELLNTAAALSSDGVYGLGYPAVEELESLFLYIPFIWAEGGDVEDPYSENCTRSLKLLSDLAENNALSRNDVNASLMDIIREFANGKVAMMLAPSGREEQILAINPDLKFDVAPVPTGDSQITTFSGEGITILSTEHCEEAGEFIKFMSQPENMLGYLDSMGYLAPQKELLKWQLSEYPKYRQYYDYLQNSDARAFSVPWPDGSQIMAERIHEAILGEENTKAAEE